MTRKELYRRVPYTYLTDPGARKFVYVIKCGEFVKIGISANVERRLTEVNLHNPFRATIAMRGEIAACLALKAETDLHRRFASARHRREWFKLTPTEVRQTFRETIALAHEVERAFNDCLDAYHKARENHGKPRIARAQKAKKDQDHAQA